MIQGMREVAELPDPVGRVLSRTVRPNGLLIEKVSVPFGVVAIIYESRPNVTSDAAALCLKSGNVCVLRSGKEAAASSHAIVKAMQRGLDSCSLPREFVNILDDISREGAAELMRARGFVDLLIPRGVRDSFVRVWKMLRSRASKRGSGFVIFTWIEVQISIWRYPLSKTRKPAVLPSAMRRRFALSIGMLQRHSCRGSRSALWIREGRREKFRWSFAWTTVH